MSCGCNGSSSAVNAGLNNALTVNNGYTTAVVNPLNNGYTQSGNFLTSGYTQAVVNPLNNGFTTVNSGYPLNTGFTTVNSSANCNSLVGATYTTLNPVEQSYTSNPQVTALPGTQPINLTVGTSNYVPSVTVPLLSAQSGFVNYYVRSTPTYFNTCY